MINYRLQAWVGCVEIHTVNLVVVKYSLEVFAVVSALTVIRAASEPSQNAPWETILYTHPELTRYQETQLP